MPEGDSIHKTAQFLAAALDDQILRHAWLRRSDAGPLIGARVGGLSTQGKYLFIRTDRQLTLRVHLGLYGSWHRYIHGAQWQRPRRQAALILETERAILVCFNAREASLVGTQDWELRDQRLRLGPDLIRDPGAARRAPARARRLLPGDTLLVDVLLDQRMASGIGNVYKSEILFIAGLAPTVRLRDLDDRRLRGLYSLAADLLCANLHGGRRDTRLGEDDGGPLWVYGRQRRPCLGCATRIERRRLGLGLRPTYFCPRCQTRPAPD
jgi:endonuclease-8